MCGSGLPFRPARRYDAKGAVAPSNKGDIEAVSYTRPYHKAGDLLVCSWGRTLAILGLGVVLVGVVGWAALSGSLSSINTWNIPVIHPYPPPGFAQNPFGPKGD